MGGIAVRPTLCLSFQRRDIRNTVLVVCVRARRWACMRGRNQRSSSSSCDVPFPLRMAVQMIPASIQPVTVCASVPCFPVFGIIVPLNVFRITKCRVAESTLVPTHLLGVVCDSVMTVYMCQHLHETSKRRKMYLLETSLVFVFLAAFMALKARSLYCSRHGICQVLQLTLSSGTTAGNIRR